MKSPRFIKRAFASLAKTTEMSPDNKPLYSKRLPWVVDGYNVHDGGLLEAFSDSVYEEVYRILGVKWDDDEQCFVGSSEFIKAAYSLSKSIVTCAVRMLRGYGVQGSQNLTSAESKHE